ncbi:RNA-binding protein 44-like isoform X2 [Phasianus colchicus]|uniref:RNA-binding protein 44-like isoform X2 n=1 Tax=Phasianus colchicus TaxID=9054 RepID=UPI00129DDDAB|nr:RNA-binding protein 44-like isoform X2 [Phasianus colchicus]
MELQEDDAKSKQRLMHGSLLCPRPREAQQSTGRGLAALPEESLPYLSTSLDADIDVYNARMRTCSAEVDDSQKEADVLRRACGGGTQCSCGVCGGGSPVQVGEDSQLEYISANEEGFDDGNSSSELSEQREGVGMEALVAVDPVHDVAGGGAAKEQNLADSTSERCTAVPELPQLLQDSQPVGSGRACGGKEEQAASLSGLAGSMCESHAYGNRERSYPNLLVHDHAEVEDASLRDGMQPKQNNCNLVEQGSPLLSARERALATATQFCKSAGDSDFYSCEEPFLCMCGASCAYCASKGDEKQRPVPAVLTSKDLCSGEEACSANTTASLNLECCESLVNVVSNSKVNQAVDASSDFRVCFTTSRSTSARVPLLSRAINTEMTMMNKFRHVGWLGETCASVACSTDWLSGAGPTEEMGSQLADVHQDGSAAAANERSSQVKEQWESKTELCSDGLKIKADRPAHLNKETVKDSVSVCQNLLQRAIEAELQVLNAHYQMCYQHCLKIYKLALEENACFSRYHGNTSPNTELGSSVTSVLEELKKNYSSMRAKIQMGTPLSALPPLSVEIKLLPIVSSYVPCKLFREELCHGSVSGMRKAGFEAPTLQEIRTPVNVGSAQTTSLTDGQQPSDSASSKMSQEQLKEQGVQHEAKITEGANECSFVCVGGLSSSVSEGDLRLHFQKYQISVLLLCADSDNHRCAVLGFRDTSAAKLAVEEMNRTKIKGKPISVGLVNNPSENRSSASRILGKKLWGEALSVASSASSDQNETLPSASGSVGAPGTSSASQKVPLMPRASSPTPCSTQVPSEAKCPKSSAEDSVHFLFAVNQKDTGENSLPKAPAAPLSSNSLEAFMSPNSLNLSSFAKLMKKLKDIHPEASRDKIVDALLKVRKNNNGVLSGLSISSIMQRTSEILRKPTPAGTGKGSVNQTVVANTSQGPALRCQALLLVHPEAAERFPRSRGWAAGGAVRTRFISVSTKQARRTGTIARQLPARRQPGSSLLAMALLPRRFLCFVLAHHFIAATACHEAEYGRQIRERCLRPFKLSMEGIGQQLWCDWDETMGTYGELTNCTVAVAENLTCYWPNRLVDEFFVAVHSHYFRNCSPSGRALRDPPNGILCPFILVPILVTLLMTALVVWRSKRSEGIV